jgi:cellobiose-specific phosphotransferase system component IIB
MKISLFRACPGVSRTRRRSLVAVCALVCFAGASTGIAQQRISKRYPTGKNVRLQLKNIQGTITVESWDRDEIKVSATLESPSAQFSPRQLNDGLSIDVMSDNRGRGDVGDVNFKIQVPVNTSVDVETRRGDIHVSNVRGESLRARVSSEGDIDLTGITATRVEASNTSGDILFDGEFARGGSYEFLSGHGAINIRIPGNSAFRLVAATTSKKIALGHFWNNSFQSFGGGRKYVGDVGDGRASVTVTNLSGSISFIRR